jgi:hypothetical protein
MHRTATIDDLPGAQPFAYDINSNGQIVGNAPFNSTVVTDYL